MGSGTASSADCVLEPGAGCGDSDGIGPAILTGLVGAAIGGGLGYVIGQWSSKPRPAAADSTAR
jgi:membrane protein DedA with SNARE-associated domain